MRVTGEPISIVCWDIDYISSACFRCSTASRNGRPWSICANDGHCAVQLWQQDKVQWTREESLSEIKVAEMIELPEKKSVMSHMNVENETMSGRLSRQLMDAKVGFVCVGAKTIY